MASAGVGDRRARHRRRHRRSRAWDRPLHETASRGTRRGQRAQWRARAARRYPHGGPGAGARPGRSAAVGGQSPGRQQSDPRLVVGKPAIEGTDGSCRQGCSRGNAGPYPCDLARPQAALWLRRRALGCLGRVSDRAPRPPPRFDAHPGPRHDVAARGGADRARDRCEHQPRRGRDRTRHQRFQICLSRWCGRNPRPASKAI